MTAPRFFEFTAAPGVNDDGSAKGFKRGDFWWDSTNSVMYCLATPTAGAAVWQAVAGSLIAAGSATNISVPLTPKGTGVVRRATIAGLGGVGKIVVTNITTAGAETYTAAQIKGGVITRDPTGAGRTDTLPTAALLVAAIPGAAVGDAFEFVVKNTADMAEAITVQAGDGGTGVGDLAIAQNEAKRFLVILDNVTSGAEAYSVYNMGVFSHNT